MFNRKLKLSVISEYINICSINKVISQNTCKNANLLHYSSIASDLQKKYELILFKIGCMDLSFAILKKEINTTNSCVKFDNLDKICDRFGVVLDEYNANLAYKMRKLSFNNFEQNFVKNFNL